MRTRQSAGALALVMTLALGHWGCSNSHSGASGAGGAASTGKTTSPAGGSGGASGATTGMGGSASGGGSSASGGSRATGGMPGTGGAFSRTGGSAAGGASGGGKGGASAGTGGAGAGGAKVDAAEITEAGATGGDCAAMTWPTADPSAAGPFPTVTENNVGPVAGVGLDGGAPPQFTLFRPKDLGLCHPVITWGNGTSANPSMYKVLLNNLASHGFVVIASNSPNVAQGNPAPMIVGVTWVLQQNDDPTSELYHHIDPTRIGATGHSQGAMATSQAATDSHITTNVPIEGAQSEKNLHGPAMFFCGGQDTIVGCSGAQSALKTVTTLPAMSAEYVSVDHGSWLTFTGNKPSVVEATVTAWMRVHLMGDSELRPWFYGASCKLCTDSAWIVSQKNMDQ